MKRTSIILFASLTLFVAGILAGCGDQTPPSAPPSAPANSSVEPAVSAPEASAAQPASPAPETATAEPAPAGDGEPKGEMKAVEPAAATAAEPAAVGPKSYELSLDTKILWAASVPVGTRKGGWSDFTGTIELDNGNFETAKINVEVVMSSVFSDAAEITTKMKGDEHFFAPGKYPTSTFKSTSVKKTATGYDVTGDLTIRDKTKSVVLPVTDLKIDAKTLTCKSTVVLNRHDFDIEYNTAIGDYVINKDCELSLVVVADAI